MDGEGYVGLLSFCSFVFSVIAAVLAIDLYALLRTGRSGATWRVLIIASVMFALMHALRLAELLNFGLFRLSHLSEIVELMFVMALAYAFYLQRKAFGSHERPSTSRTRPAPRASAGAPEPAPSDDGAPSSSLLEPEPDPEDNEDEEEAASEWARLSGQPDGSPHR